MDYWSLLVLLLILALSLLLFFRMPLSGAHKRLLVKASLGVISANEVAMDIVSSPDSRAYKFKKYKAEVIMARQRHLVRELIRKL